MNRMLDLGEMPDEPIVKANESMNGQFRPDNIVDLTVSYKWNKRRAIDHKEGISLPNFFYRLDF